MSDHDWIDAWLPPAAARSTDPDTSRAAAASVTGIRATQQAVLELFRVAPMTDPEMIAKARALGLPQSESGLRTRRSELVNQGLLADTRDRRRTPSGRQSIVWGLAGE